jgi:hypothetical protein
MRRVGGIVGDLLCVVSLGVLVLGVGLWVRSFGEREGVYWNFAERTGGEGRWCDVYAYVFRGGVSVGRNRYDAAVWGMDGQAGLHYRRSARWTVQDESNMRQAYGHGGLGFEWLRWRARDAGDFDFAMVRAPLWAVCAVAAVGPVVRVRRWMRVRGRVNRGRCAGCGYDLRATPGRCPECGLTSGARLVHPRREAASGGVER